MKIKSTLLIFILILISVRAQESSQTFLELKDTGVEEFIKLHPEYDGRGTILFVLDTGVDVGVEGLLKTSTGETKIIDVQDFSTEGDFNIYDADVEKDGSIIVFSNSSMGFSVKASENKLYNSSRWQVLYWSFTRKTFSKFFIRGKRFSRR